jgi:hypothetical protein
MFSYFPVTDYFIQVSHSLPVFRTLTCWQMFACYLNKNTFLPVRKLLKNVFRYTAQRSDIKQFWRQTLFPELNAFYYFLQTSCSIIKGLPLPLDFKKEREREREMSAPKNLKYFRKIPNTCCNYLRNMKIFEWFLSNLWQIIGLWAGKFSSCWN